MEVVASTVGVVSRVVVIWVVEGDVVVTAVSVNKDGCQHIHRSTDFKKNNPAF